MIKNEDDKINDKNDECNDDQNHKKWNNELAQSVAASFS